jgi:hypothetical protein
MIVQKANRDFKDLVLAVMAPILVILFFPSILMAQQYQMKGRVVKYGGSEGIAGVKVEVRYSEKGKVEEKDSTKEPNGDYRFSVPISEERVWITYTPDDPKKYSAEGRAGVPNSADPKDLDTIGLVSKEEACVNGTAAIVAAWGAMRYLQGGGNREVVESFSEELRKANCVNFVKAVRNDPRLVDSLKNIGIYKWTQ